eukprot:403367542
MQKAIEEYQAINSQYLRFAHTIIDEFSNYGNYISTIFESADRLFNVHTLQLINIRFSQFQKQKDVLDDRQTLDKLEKLILINCQANLSQDFPLRSVTQLDMKNSKVFYVNSVFPNLKYLKVKDKNNLRVEVYFYDPDIDKIFEKLENASIKFPQAKLNKYRIDQFITIFQKAQILKITCKAPILEINEVEQLFQGATKVQKYLKSDNENKASDLLIKYKKNKNKEEFQLISYEDDKTD